MISDVPVEQLPMVWGQVEPMLERALKHGQGDEVDSEVILMNLVKGHSSLWVIHDKEPTESDEAHIRAAVVVSLIEVPTRGSKLAVDLLAGEGMKEWVHELQRLLEQARDSLGAFCVEASCRKGLARFLERELGWRQKAAIMEFR